ncbi:MAG: CRISPR-associated endonuclease Cas3'', partial [Acidobacteriota bacterium]
METAKQFFAHTLPGRPPSDWEPLRDHLEAVAARAAEFGEQIGAREWAELAGLWHDLGKYSLALQEYLRTAVAPDPHIADLEDETSEAAGSRPSRSGARVDHSSAGAQHAAGADPVFGQLLAYVIAGHHSGLLDWLGDGACLSNRLGKAIEPWTDAPADLLDRPLPDPPQPLRLALGQGGKKRAFAVAFFTRMLFSCLIDADFLETERFMSSERAASRPAWPEDILARMEQALDAHVAGFTPDPTPVNHQRTRVREACLTAAELEPGLFSLTVPTGGGKTLSSVAFALRHARLKSLDRVIYVAPFTTIIEQNADSFRQALATLSEAGLPDPVVEHHSNLETGKETVLSRLASENWAAPLVVTTSVQFYESLFANRTSRCRKLHNLARSVIVLDEAQALPVDLLAPCLRALDELTRAYGASVVLCTATQPAVQQRDGFPIGLSGVREIIDDPPRLYEALRRVELRDIGLQDDEALAQRLRRAEQVLCVVNTRGHARALFEKLGA